MEMVVNSSAVPLSIALLVVVIAAVITKVAVALGRRTAAANQAPPRNTTRPRHPSPPAVITGVTSAVRLVHALATKGFEATLYEQYAKLGSVFTLSFLGTKTTFLAGPEVSAHFYQGPESEISHGDLLEFTVPMFGEGVAFGVDAATRAEQHRFYLDALKPARLRCHVAPMLQEVEEFFARWGQQGTVDLKQELEQVLMLITARCLLGKEVRERMLDEVVAAFRDLTENSLHLTSLLFPYAPTPAARRRDRARATLASIFAEIVRSRRRSAGRRVDDDVLQSLVDARYRDGRGTTEAEVTGLVVAIIFAGKHTSSATSTWTGARLLRHAECLEAAVDEQRRVVAARGGEEVDYDALAEMGFLHCCVKEALRMHPTAPLFLRRAHRSFVVRTREGDVYEVPGGQTVASPLLINHYVPYVYRDPHVYDPRRFGPGREEDRVGGRFCYNAFSGGRHACPGEAYAYMQVKVIWSHLLRNFELRLVSPFPRTDWMKVSPEPRGKVVVSYKRRMVPVGSVLEN